jgi:hypothetical protein
MPKPILPRMAPKALQLHHQPMLDYVPVMQAIHHALQALCLYPVLLPCVVFLANVYAYFQILLKNHSL